MKSQYFRIFLLFGEREPLQTRASDAEVGTESQ